MTVARTSEFLLGTSIGTGVTIANNATSTGSEVDLLGNNTSEAGIVFVYLYYTGTVAAGTVDVSLFSAQVTGQEAEDQSPLIASVVPINGTQKILLGTMVADRFVIGQVKNNAVTASLTNVSLGISLYAES